MTIHSPWRTICYAECVLWCVIQYSGSCSNVHGINAVDQCSWCVQVALFRSCMRFFHVSCRTPWNIQRAAKVSTATAQVEPSSWCGAIHLWLQGMLNGCRPCSMFSIGSIQHLSAPWCILICPHPTSTSCSWSGAAECTSARRRPSQAARVQGKLN